MLGLCAMCFAIKVFQYTLRGKKAGIDNIEVFTADVGMLETISGALHLAPNDPKI